MGKKIKLSLFNKEATKDIVINSNGNYCLDNICIRAESKQELDTGDYTLDCTFLLDKEGLYKIIEKEMILKVLIDGVYEIFRIVNIVATTKDLQVFARQITIETTLGMQLGDVRPTGLGGLASLLYLKENSNEYKQGKQYAKDLEVWSNLTTVSTAYYEEVNMYQALHDCDQSFKNRWGGEIIREGYKLSILDRVGKDRGFQVMSRKNLIGFEANTSINNVITVIKPKGFNGITIDGYVISPLANHYIKSKTKVIEYTDVKVRNENTSEDEDGMIFDTLEEAQHELMKRANLEFKNNLVDEPSAEYRVSFIPLEQTEEYKNYSILEQCKLGDIVRVFEEKHNINITVRCKSIRYDILKQRIIEIELSNKDLSRSNSLESIIKQLETIPDEKGLLSKAKDQAKDLINNGIEKGYFVWDTNGWAIMDTKDKNTATKGIKATMNGIGLFNNGYYGDITSAITSKGIVADVITTGILSAILIQSDNKATTLDLNSGVYRSKQPDGSEIVISPTEGFYNKFGDSKMAYHHLTHVVRTKIRIEKTVGGNFTPITVQLPDEFKGKNFKVTCNVIKVINDANMAIILGSMGAWANDGDYDYANARVTIRGWVQIQDYFWYLNSNIHEDYFLMTKSDGFNGYLTVDVTATA